ncbi:transcription factor IIA, alpha/beta subunit [Nemania sp. FL0916]|nr:transcription factor IIA, alpha/beta subunit [Nemania sp. FL0916]
MSNSHVGGVYQQIINDVIATSKVDFDESGIDEGVLEQLRKGWQKKLSQQQLAVFPWDPKPELPPAPPATAPASQQPIGPSAPLPTTNGNGYAQPQVPQPAPVPVPVPMSTGHSAGDIRIKSEPGVKIEPGLESTLPITQGDPGSNAQQRAIAQLQNQYGDRAAASIGKLMRGQPSGGVVQSQGQAGVGTPIMPQGYPAGQYQANAQQQYRQNTPQNLMGQHQRATPVNAPRPPNAQLDGTTENDDPIGVVLQRAPNGNTTEMGRVEIDGLLHAQIAANAKAMEGGGLMLPLKRVNKGKGKQTIVSNHNARTQAGPSQFDGPDYDTKGEDDEVDEDAINSDLDDPDDYVEDDEDDEEGKEIMLCMYDKVQRVKNKWKCVLKDGVLNVNGKDYVFHKATGEFEW